ncbi:MAG: FeoB-associated Cys-rich membrane protein [Clostridia bacterium]|nr:FeoB-associated Cys-rich membrane protein [Clostridia bacterium]
MTVGTVIVSAVLVVIVGLIISRQIKNKKEGKSSCSCGCSGCAMSDVCHGKK